MKYLVVLLDDTSVSYCHYDNAGVDKRLISLDDLKAGIVFAMKENLMIQFVYPDYELPQSYKDLINSVSSSKIVPIGYIGGGDVLVVDDLKNCLSCSFDGNSTYVVRTMKNELFDNADIISNLMGRVFRLNVIVKDIETVTSEDFDKYMGLLQMLRKKAVQLYDSGKSPQLNILTDRLFLPSMNNCDAGWESIALAPDGKFYVCPAFYHNGGKDIGDIKNGLDIKNPHLFCLSYAPLCRDCDAYHCKRCIWLNQKLTYEVNTPSHQQCVLAHLERNAGRDLLNEMRTHITDFFPGLNIDEIEYLDPIEKIINRK